MLTALFAAPQIKAFVELVGALLSASAPMTGTASHTAPAAGLSIEMIRAMRDAGVVKALTNSLSLIDNNHPQVTPRFHPLVIR